MGPLIIAGVLLNKEKEKLFKEKGVKDSKLLSHKKRCELAEFIKRNADDYVILTITVEEIDAAVDHENKSYNLNWLEADKSVEIIEQLEPDVAILDCPSPNIKKYKAYVQERVGDAIELIVEHKADVNHVACSAASILAKCLREEEMEKIQKKYGNTGPGYTSNLTTQKFLKENWNKHPEIFRKSWISWKNHRDEKKQKKLDEFEC
ncbi:MAG: ribonuclease HII [Nanoarchaeota archaeon]